MLLTGVFAVVVKSFSERAIFVICFTCRALCSLPRMYLAASAILLFFIFEPPFCLGLSPFDRCFLAFLNGGAARREAEELGASKEADFFVFRRVGETDSVLAEPSDPLLFLVSQPSSFVFPSSPSDPSSSSERE